MYVCKGNTMESINISVVFVMIGMVLGSHAQDVCPAIQCPRDAKIPADCRKAEFVIGSNQRTKCRVCDSNLCGKPGEVCPAIQCPLDHKLKADCRKPNFVIGSDDITKCRVCDSNLCGRKGEVCPQIQCPDIFIPKRCRARAFVIGTDGITRCRVCDRDRCESFSR